MNISKSFSTYYNKVESYLVSWDLKKLARNMSILAIVVGLAGGYLWYSRMYMTNERRFWLAVENSMATQSVTRSITSGGTGNQVVQDQQFFFSPQMASRSHVMFSQKGATVDTLVETEGISFPGEQYSRYTAFETNQKKEDGSSPTLDGVLDKWGSSIATEDEQETARQNYISDIITLAVFGNYDAKFRRDVVQQLQSNNSYRLNIEGIQEDVIDGKKVIIYPVSVGLQSFVTQLQRAFVKAGYGEFPPLNPENYREDARLNAQFTVDPKNNSIVGINFGERQEFYKGYGIFINVEPPKVDFSNDELEAIVQEEIQSAL